MDIEYKDNTKEQNEPPHIRSSTQSFRNEKTMVASTLKTLKTFTKSLFAMKEYYNWHKQSGFLGVTISGFFS